MFEIIALAPAWCLFIVDGTMRKALLQISVSKLISSTRISKAIIMSAIMYNRTVASTTTSEDITRK